jgi:hypothetical protein
MPWTIFVSWVKALLVRCKDRGCTMNARKTKTLLQQDYEAKYTGPVILLEDRYSTIIAMTMVIMMYGLTMPCLYIAGALIFTSYYWSDKIMFTNFWATPPRYTTELARRSLVLLEFATFLHLIFGLFMISNPQIFAYESGNTHPSLELMLPIAQLIGRWANSWFGVGEDRFI